MPPSEHAPGLPPALDAVTMRGLSVDPAGRFATAREMARALEDALPARAGLEDRRRGSRRGQGRRSDERSARIASIESDSSLQVSPQLPSWPAAGPSPLPPGEGTPARGSPVASGSPLPARRLSRERDGGACGSRPRAAWRSCSRPHSRQLSRSGTARRPRRPSSARRPAVWRSRRRQPRRGAHPRYWNTPGSSSSTAVALPTSTAAATATPAPTAPVTPPPCALPRPTAAPALPHTLDDQGRKYFKPECFTK